ncbi:leucyl aminopeptidase family protein [Methylovirgula sp. 4M-Z18]|uniref:leucyl aminopeptidase family protein n=1 Tax=Methylovirgula sp. 4M-Z18 TaxID=2293567 RepID=UPI000E2FA245|nr:leucyl aminopeptidase family protein [Methylovirgula sp. 4M-Z18]RFB78499.1 leucyl aminopeptidase family protein [Methylovirgula sp. 4M-Z18]
MSAHFAKPTPESTPIFFATTETWSEVKKNLSAEARTFCDSCGFEPKSGRHIVVPDTKGRIGAVVMGLESGSAWRDGFLPGKLAALLPVGTYHFSNDPHDVALGALGWLLGSYHFTRYRKSGGSAAGLVAPEGVDAKRLESIARAVTFGRDLVNTPTNDMGPQALEDAAAHLAKEHEANLKVTRGEKLLEKNFPLIHAVGRAATQEPRLIDLRWGNKSAPKITLVGKGVCFDTGGLDIKPSSSMLLMKKDMGGAAAALALAAMIMEADLPVRLRVLIPAVENSIASDAFRPSDIYVARNGLSVEIGNTDAEGRLVLADALALASEDEPDLLMDFATLTGAARTALGPDLPAFYTNDETFAGDVATQARASADPVWRMPLWPPYAAMMDGKISDLNNSGNSAFAGSITAALFLKRFVGDHGTWAHFDMYAWNPKAGPGRPEGGEVQVARMLFDLLAKRYG